MNSSSSSSGVCWLAAVAPDSTSPGTQPYCSSEAECSLVARCSSGGGQDGWLRVWGGGSGAAVAEVAVHVDRQGKGAVASILTGCGCSRQLVVTAGADKTLKVLIPGTSWQLLHNIHLMDFPYSLAAGSAAGFGIQGFECGAEYEAGPDAQDSGALVNFSHELYDFLNGFMPASCSDAPERGKVAAG
eukprot:gene5015-5256_t